MPIHNAEIAETFNEYADLLEIKNANQYRVRAYRTAARNVSNLSRSAAEMVNKKEDISQLPGFGKDLAGKVADIVNTGKLPQLEELKKELPAELLEISKLEGLGPKRTGLLYQKLGITSIEELEEAARKQKVRALPGFAAKTERKILDEIGRKGKGGEAKKRYKLSVIEELAGPLLD
ncbi:MAG: helix-hairpin-helix domain-containing protein, partial [Dehalococcoidia bacterium]